MAASRQFCCMHPQPRIDSPEPPSRPPASLDGIFAAAALPEDHPHALQLRGLKEKKPELDPSIVRSPGLTDKIRMQWRKKSVRSLGREKEYDGDAHAITSREVLVELHALHGSERTEPPPLRVRACDDGLLLADPSRHAFETDSKAELRNSVLESAEYLRPLIEQPSSVTTGSEPSCDIVDVANCIAAQRVHEDVAREQARPLPPLPKSLSSPLLLPWSESPAPIKAGRSTSDLAVDGVLRVPQRRSAVQSDGFLSPAAHKDDLNSSEKEQVLETSAVPSLHVQEPIFNEDDAVGLSIGIVGQQDRNAQKTEEDRHLHTMDISHQLRSMSQLSDPVDDGISASSHNPWNFHRRERFGIDFESSARNRHSRNKSSTGIDSTAIPSTWGRVRSPTAASSIYSRPTSAGANAPDNGTSELDRPPYAIPHDLDALFADWPLQSAANPNSSGSGSRAARHHASLPPVPSNVCKDSSPESIVICNDAYETEKITGLSPPSGGDTAPRTSSSSIISGSSKKSKFLDRFSPPKRLVRKRRSIFKFLRPGSRKQQTRSVSTPVLSMKSPSGAYDGPSDDPALLTVQYELVEQSTHAQRSASMNELGSTVYQSTPASQRPSQHSLQRRSTLADYEQTLSIAGDDRRRSSSVNAVRLTEIQEEDRKESIGSRRRLSRAKGLRDDASPLMAQALTKHQQEKDMFRSSSKRRDAARVYQPTPLFSAPSFGNVGSSLAPTPEDQGERLDPLDQGEHANTSPRDKSAGYLSPLTAAAPSCRASTPATKANLSTTPPLVQSNTAQHLDTVTRPPKVATSLASWSRYPSHTRFERCGSAGRPDNVITRDFAFHIDPENIGASDESDAGSPAPSRANKAHRTQAKRLHKSRSLTFGSILRYYSNLFHTSGWAGQNRRTSVTMGGRLDRPELEMLPPQVPMDRQHGRDTLRHLKEIVKEDAENVKDFVHEEEDKLEDYIHKEEVKLESYVREEGDKIEKFMNEEEERLEGFVKKEEGKMKKFVRDEEEKWKQYQGHRHAEHSSTPFRHGSIFEAAEGGSHTPRRDTMISPNNDEKDTPNGLHLDGAAVARTTELPPSGPSKAQLWSEIYQQCIVKPSSKEQLRSESLPAPPSAKAIIRRFPSVTVVDDRKGHYRSISLISVMTGRS